MYDEETLEWCKEQLEMGVSKSDISKGLFERGYTGSEVKEIMSSLGVSSPAKKKASNEEIIEWCRKNLDDGVSDELLTESLFQEGYLGDEVVDILKEARKRSESSGEKKVSPPPLESVYSGGDSSGLLLLDSPGDFPEEKASKSKVHYKAVSRKTSKNQSLSELFDKEKKTIVVFAIFSFLLLFLIFIGAFFLFSSGNVHDVSWDPSSPSEVDDLPPTVSLNASGWMDDSPTVVCSDNGKNYAVGCDETSYRYFFSDTDSCPEDYGLYSPDVSSLSGSGFLCVSAKDNDGNAGFSVPLSVSFDQDPPVSGIAVTDGWFDKDFTVFVTDSDSESDLDSCFYRLSPGSTDWEERECNSDVMVIVGQGGCSKEGKSACVLEVYAVDKAGNKGKIKKTNFDIDLDIPEVSILSVKPSEEKNDFLVISEKQVIVSISIKDVSLSSYSLELTQEDWSELIESGSQPDHTSIVWDTGDIPEGDYVLVLTAVDAIGRERTDSIKVSFSGNIDYDCTPGEVQSCYWLKGVCSASERICKETKTWGACDFDLFPDYQEQEQNCSDGLDNDCDGDSDAEDSDCGGDGAVYSCPPGRRIGDLTGDGVIDEDDADIVDLIVDGDAVLSGDDCCVDVNSDGLVSSVDVSMINDFADDLRECFPGGYSCSEREHCNDSLDNDCDSWVDAVDPDCGGSCEDAGFACAGCSCGVACCEECDPDDGHCFSCVDGVLDSEDMNRCESSGSCTASSSCDELSPVSITSGGNICCSADCAADNTVGDSPPCVCSGGNCGDGYCVSGDTCYYGVTCSEGGWSSSSCPLGESCEGRYLQETATCSVEGCSSDAIECSSYQQCETETCAGSQYTCIYNGTGWSWVPDEDVPSSELGFCSDGWNNDCQEGVDEEDPDCPDCGNSLTEAGEECDGEDDSACPGLCMETCVCNSVEKTYSDFCGDGVNGSSIPSYSASYCNISGEDYGPVEDCCYSDYYDPIHTHIHYMGDYFYGGILNVSYETNSEEYIQVSVSSYETYYYPIIFEGVVSGQGSLELTTGETFRYVHVRWSPSSGEVLSSGATVYCLEHEDCDNNIDNDCDGYRSTSDQDC